MQKEGGSVSGAVPAHACSYPWWIHGWDRGSASLSKNITYHTELSVSWKGVISCQCFIESK